MKNLLIILITISTSTFCKELTVENVKHEISIHNISNADIVLRQAILETGWLKSYNATKRNNLFGFWNSKKQEYFEFDNWEASVAYYMRWQKRKYKGGDYYSFLTKIGYASDPEYISKLKHIKI